MSYALKAWIGIGLAAIAAGPARAQGLVTERSLSLALAKTIAEGALEACKAKGLHTAVAVVADADGLGQAALVVDEQPEVAQTAQVFA